MGSGGSAPSVEHKVSRSPSSTPIGAPKGTSSGGSFQRAGAIAVSAKRTKTPSRLADRPQRGRADLRRLRRQSEREIARTSPPELADLPADFWEAAEVVWPVAKEAISLRVDRDVLEWFRAQGPRYQSRMNAVLRTYMTQAASRRRSRTGVA